jgi:hypothetical protein
MTPEQLALLEMYKEHAQQARQHETLRERMTAAVVAIGAAVVAFISASLRDPSVGLLLPALFVFVLGCYGAVFSRKHYERNRLHTAIMGSFRERLEASLTNTPLSKIREDAETKHNNQYSWLSRRTVHGFWDGLNLAVAAAGLVLLVVILLALHGAPLGSAI